MKDKKKLIVLIVMLLMPVAGIWYFIKMSLKYMKGAEIEIFFPNNFFKQFGVWSIIWIILWIVIMFIERKYKVKKIKERKKSIKILQCIVMFVMAVISFWIYVSILTGKFNHYMMLVFLVEIIDVFMVTLVIKIFRNLIDIYFDWKENKDAREWINSFASFFMSAYSTVTDLARFLGWSTSYPLNTVT